MAVVSLYRYIEHFRTFQRMHVHAPSVVAPSQSPSEELGIDGFHLTALTEAALVSS